MLLLYSAVTKMKPSRLATFFCQVWATALVGGTNAFEAASSKNGMGKSRRSTISKERSVRLFAIDATYSAACPPTLAALVLLIIIPIFGMLIAVSLSFVIILYQV